LTGKPRGLKTASESPRRRLCDPKLSNVFEDRGNALTTTNTLGRECVSHVLANEQGRRLPRDPRTGRTKRVANGHAAAVDINNAWIQSELASTGQIRSRSIAS
jgi:hypothetical protein